MSSDTASLPSVDDVLFRHVRAGLALMIAASLLFTVADLTFRAIATPVIIGIQAFELTILLIATLILRRGLTRSQVISGAVVIVGVLCLTTAASGVLNHDTTTPLLLITIITLGTASMLPWGLRPQLVVQCVAAIAIAWNVYAVSGLTFAVQYLLVAVVVGFGLTLYAAYAMEQHLVQRARHEAILEETRTRQHQAELAHAARLSTLGEMAAGLAHELNQPLAAIVSYATGCLVRIDAGTADMKVLAQIVTEISDEAQRAGEVLRRMREFARSGEIRRERVNPNALVRSASVLATGDARKLGVGVHLDLDGDVAHVDVDRIQIEQVILNLLLNAFEAMQETTRNERHVVVTTKMPDADVIEVAIGDSGEGLSPATANKIFDPFFTTKEDGLGLGLAISRRIVEAHGGKLWATPNSDRGTTFHFTLPAGLGERAYGG